MKFLPIGIGSSYRVAVLILLFCCVGQIARSQQWSTPDASGNMYNTNPNNLGINFSTPAAPLEAHSRALSTPSGSTAEMARFSGYAAGVSNYCQLRLFLNQFGSGSGWTYASTRMQAWTDVSPQAYIDFNPNGAPAGMAFGSGSTEGMRVMQSGNVLIGKTSQANTGYILDVNGTARANQLVVNTTGADFVFAPGYTLTPLDMVEAYIKYNRHLPGIRPADEMQNEGLDVGENQTKQLQKIEELTLYIIAQNKKLEEQEHALQQQSLAIKELQQQLQSLIENQPK